MMKRLALLSVVLVAFVIGSVVGLVTSHHTTMVQAQDDGDTTTHICDSSTIMLLFIAMYDYGYQNDELDVDSFDKGQFAFLFDFMMAMDDDEDISAMDELDMMEMEAMLIGVMAGMGDFTELGGYEGEDEACALLRADLAEFMVYNIYFNFMMAGAEGDG